MRTNGESFGFYWQVGFGAHLDCRLRKDEVERKAEGKTNFIILSSGSYSLPERVSLDKKLLEEAGLTLVVDRICPHFWGEKPSQTKEESRIN